jgi:hypothetical protein
MSAPTSRITAECWSPKDKLPTKKGWYITRTSEGELHWRAWGNGAWWKQIKGGWVEWFNGDGQAICYDWQPASRKSIDLESNQLPDIT